MRKIYLDHTATTPLDPEVFEAMRPYFLEKFGNASSVHSFGRESRVALDTSRDSIAALLGAQSGEISFVSCGTEADNFALKGIAAMMLTKGKNHIITTRAEHHAILEPCAYLSRTGFSVTFLPVDSSGRVDAGDVRRAVNARTGIVSIMHANNEVGSVNPVAELARAAGENKALFHTDAVQSFGKIPVDVNELGVDLLSLSAHKIYGPKGIGAIYIRRGVEIERFMHGGGQERGRRAGTENVALAVGFAKAASLMQKRMEDEHRRLTGLKARFRGMLEDRFPFLLFNGDTGESLPHILNVSFDSAKIEIDGEALLFNLDLAGIAATSGSACSSGSIEPSHVLIAMGRDVATARATIRFSMGVFTSADDIDQSVAELDRIVRRIGKKR
jgi:cysteine desulfurase